MTFTEIVPKMVTRIVSGAVRFVVPMLVILLAACGPGAPAGPTSTPMAVATVAPATPNSAPATATPASPVEATSAPPSTEAVGTPTATPNSETPVGENAPLSFVAATYRDESAGFELDYPAEWSVVPSSQIGVRGGQVLLLSPGTTVETIVEGGTRVAILHYSWDPENDLDAYVAQRKTAWDASGFAITREEAWQLPGDRAAYAFIVQMPEQPTFTLLTTIGEDYLQISGEGDTSLVEEIARTLRPSEE